MAKPDLLEQAFQKAVEHGQQGRPDEAAEAWQQAAALAPDRPDVHYNLGNALKALGRLEEAAAAYRQATALDDGLGDAYFNLGGVLKDLGRLEDAVLAYGDAVRVNPKDAEAHMNLGNTLDALGDTDAALSALEQAVRIKPDLAAAHYNLGNVLRHAARPDDAITAYRRALDINPNMAEFHNNLGEALLEQGDADAAIASYRLALDTQPNMTEALNNLGNALGKQGDAEAAIESYQRALDTDPDHVNTHTNMGNALGELGRWDDALTSHRRAIGIDPASAEAHHNLGLLLLLLGQMQEGWSEYEWRWRSENGAHHRDFPQPPWQGEDLKGKTLMVWSEQGVGDEILFAGMIPGLIDAGATVILECDPRMVDVFQHSFAGVTCIARAAAPDPRLFEDGTDYQAAAGSLGRWLRLTTDTPMDSDMDSEPGAAAYLTADGARRDGLRKSYQTDGAKHLVGIAWNSKNKQIGDKKSLSLAELSPLAGVAGVQLVDLQYGDTRAERDAFATETGREILHDDGIDQMADLDAFAAQVAAMDLVITVSNTTAHFAAALGVATWVMVHPTPLPCWLLDRGDSPWYPSAQIFRQGRLGQWGEVIDRVADRLRSL